MRFGIEPVFYFMLFAVINSLRPARIQAETAS
jgi:hypothetical protein